jgi:alcohol dehydrogenase
MLPAGARHEDIWMMADSLRTVYEFGVHNGELRPGQVVAVVGVGPIGL